eukprot:EG_transcript_14922
MGQEARALLAAIQDALEAEELLLFSAFLKFDPTLSAGVESDLFLSLIRAVHPSLGLPSLQASIDTGILQPTDQQLVERIAGSDDSHIQFIEFLDWWAGQRSLPDSEVAAVRTKLVAEAMASRVRRCVLDPAEYDVLLATGDEAERVRGLQSILWQCRLWRTAVAARAAEAAERAAWRRPPEATDNLASPAEAARAFRALALEGRLDRAGLQTACRLLRFDPPQSLLDLTDRLYFAPDAGLSEADFLRWWACRRRPPEDAPERGRSPSAFARFCGF